MTPPTKCCPACLVCAGPRVASFPCPGPALPCPALRCPVFFSCLEVNLVYFCVPGPPQLQLHAFKRSLHIRVRVRVRVLYPLVGVQQILEPLTKAERLVLGRTRLVQM